MAYIIFVLKWSTKEWDIFLQAENEGPRTERANSRGAKPMGGGMDMMAEMQRKLAARSGYLRPILRFNFFFGLNFFKPKINLNHNIYII